MYPFDEGWLADWLQEGLDGIQQHRESMCLSFLASRGIDSLTSLLWWFPCLPREKETAAVGVLIMADRATARHNQSAKVIELSSTSDMTLVLKPLCFNHKLRAFALRLSVCVCALVEFTLTGRRAFLTFPCRPSIMSLKQPRW